jgi:N-acetylneuraminic acid mutarotase
MAAAAAMTLSALIALITWLTGGLAVAASGGVVWGVAGAQPVGTLEAFGVAVGGKLYAFGGFDATRLPVYTPTARASVFDPVSDRWTALAPLPAQNATGRGGLSHAGVATDGRDIFFAGGYTANAAGSGQIFGTVEVYRYTVASNTYTRLPDLPQIRAAGAMVYLDGRLHFLGGTNRARDRETPEHWALDLSDPAAGWVARAPLPNPRNHLASAVLDGRIYVAGGQHGQDAASSTQSELDVYDPVADRWTTRAPLPSALSHITATVLDGQLLVLGGETSYNHSTATAYAYDPQANTWTALSPLPAPRFAGVTATINTTVYYAGGSFTTTTYKGTPRVVVPPTASTGPSTATTRGSTTTTGTATQPGSGAPTPPGTQSAQGSTLARLRHVRLSYSRGSGRLTVRFDPSVAGRVTIRLERRAHARWNAVGRAVRVQAGGGRQTTVVLVRRARVGRHRATLTLRTADGRAGHARATITIRR